MKAARIISLVMACILVLSFTIQAQSIEKKAQFELRLGLWNQVTDERSSVAETGSILTSKSTGVKGGAAFEYALKENLAVSISIELMIISTDGESAQFRDFTQKSIISPILLGAKYYFLKSTHGKNIKPYVTVKPGIFVAKQNRVENESDVIVPSVVGLVFGGYLGTGANILLGDLFMLNLGAGYYLMSDFSDPISGSKNFSGPAFNLGFSFLFGVNGE